MDEISNRLFVGTSEDAGDERLLRQNGITAIISLTYHEPDGGFPADITVIDAPMTDGPQNDREAFRQAVLETVSQLDAGNRILVHCSAGASRSPTVAATTLALYQAISLTDALEQVAERRPEADPHNALIRQAARVYTELRE